MPALSIIRLLWSRIWSQFTKTTTTNLIQALSDLLQPFTLELAYILLAKANTPLLTPNPKGLQGPCAGMWKRLKCLGNWFKCQVWMLGREKWRGRVCLLVKQTKVLLTVTECGRIGFSSRRCWEELTTSHHSLILWSWQSPFLCVTNKICLLHLWCSIEAKQK